MEIWLKQGKKALRLPILPAELQNEGEQDNKTETVNKTGEVNLLGLDKLDTIPLSAHFPDQPRFILWQVSDAFFSKIHLCVINK